MKNLQFRKFFHIPQIMGFDLISFYVSYKGYDRSIIRYIALVIISQINHNKWILIFTLEVDSKGGWNASDSFNHATENCINIKYVLIKVIQD